MNYLLHGLFEQVHWNAGKAKLSWSPFKNAGFAKVWLGCRLRLIKIISTHIGKIGTTSSWWFPNYPLSELRNFNVELAFWTFQKVQLSTWRFEICDLQSKRLLPEQEVINLSNFFLCSFSFHEFSRVFTSFFIIWFFSTFKVDDIV